jgi:iron-sulfur cluster insertion protein
MSIPLSTPELTIDPVTLTLAAATKVKELIDEIQNPKLNLRVYIEGGGCSGLKYEFTFDEVIEEDDIVITKTLPNGQVKLLINHFIMQYLEDAEIDYQETIAGAQFIIRNNNPNIKTTCGCGSSFSVAE